MNLALEIVNKIVQLGLFQEAGKDIFSSILPDKVGSHNGRSCSVFEYSSMPVNLSLSIMRRKIQIVVRSESFDTDPYEVARVHSWKVFNALCDPEKRTIVLQNATINIKPLQGPHFMSLDGNDRARFVFNVEIVSNRD